MNATTSMKKGTNKTVELTDEEIRNIICRSYQYVAMYNTNNNFAMQESNPYYTGGWNNMFVPQGLADHNMTSIPRPNNDTLYLMSMLDMRDDAIVIEFPVIESKYVSLETSAYDHYVNVPLSTAYGTGDFTKRTTMLFYTERTKGYNGKPIEGIDKTLKMTGDFAVAFLRVAPPRNEEGLDVEGTVEAMNSQKLMTLSEFQGKPSKSTKEPEFPAFSNDQAVFKNNFLEVMQFVFNYTTFDRDDEMDQAVLAALKPLGVEPGKRFDPEKVAQIDGERFAAIAEEVADKSLKQWNDPGGNPFLTQVFLPKGEMTIEPMTVQSAVGPIGLPYHQAQYPGIGTKSGELLNSKNHYVIRMTEAEMPPAQAFWSFTLYDAKKGLFIPNDNYKYSVGENAGMKLVNGGIEVHISSTQPEGVPAENWLPSGTEEQNLDIIMRVYQPDLDTMPNWTAPKAEKQ